MNEEKGSALIIVLVFMACFTTLAMVAGGYLRTMKKDSLIHVSRIEARAAAIGGIEMALAAAESGKLPFKIVEDSEHSSLEVTCKRNKAAARCRKGQSEVRIDVKFSVGRSGRAVIAEWRED